MQNIITRSQGESIAHALGMKVELTDLTPTIPIFGQMLIDMAQRIAELEKRVQELEDRI
jgi:hypothetical protein